MFAGLIAERRAAPADDLLSALVQAADAEPGRITDAELNHNLILLLGAGFETTTNLLGNGAQLVLDNAAARAGRRSELIRGLMAGDAAALARLEGTVAFPRLFGRFPELASAGRPNAAPE